MADRQFVFHNEYVLPDSDSVAVAVDCDSMRLAIAFGCHSMVAAAAFDSYFLLVAASELECESAAATVASN